MLTGAGTLPTSAERSRPGSPSSLAKAKSPCLAQCRICVQERPHQQGDPPHPVLHLLQDPDTGSPLKTDTQPWHRRKGPKSF